MSQGQYGAHRTRDYLTSDVPSSNRLFPMYLVAVGPASHRLAKRKGLEVQDLEREPLLLTHPNSASRMLLGRACQAEGLTRFRDIRMENRSVKGFVRLAEGGYGIAVSMSTLASERPDAAVIPVYLRGEHLGIWYSVIWLRRRVASVGLWFSQASLDMGGSRMQAPWDKTWIRRIALRKEPASQDRPDARRKRLTRQCDPGHQCCAEHRARPA
jgi:DNA-binding transcriptional LysR family regulator